MNTLTHKRGDTFDYSGQLTSVGTESVASMVGWSIRAQARTHPGSLVCEFEASWLDAAQRTFRLRCADTSAWSTALLEVDIQLTSPAGDVVSSPTFGLNVVNDVTK